MSRQFLPETCRELHSRALCSAKQPTGLWLRFHSTWRPRLVEACWQRAKVHGGAKLRHDCHVARVAELDAHPVDACSAPSIDSVDHQAGLYTIHGSLHTDLGEDAVLDVLTDYNGLSRIYNNIEDCEVFVTDLEKQVLQTCRWEFLVFSGTFETRLTVHEARQHGEVVFNLISSSFMRQFQGAWKVSALPGGGCRVQHRLSVQPSLAPPEALATYTKKIFVRQVERLLEDLSRELWRIQAQS